MLKRILLYGIVATICMTANPAGAATDAEILAAIKRVLQQHPEIVLEVLQNQPEAVYKVASKGASIAQEKAWAQQIKKAMEKPLQPDLSGGRAAMGKDGAPFTVVIYTDFSCGACAANEHMVPDLMKKRPGQIKAVLKHYPSDDFSRKAALYFEATVQQDQQKAWEFQKQVFEKRQALGEKGIAGLQQLAEEMDLDKEKLAADLADPALEKRIAADEAEAIKFRLGSTPSYLINGVPVIGAAPVKAMEKVMDILEGKEPLNSNK